MIFQLLALQGQRSGQILLVCFLWWQIMMSYPWIFALDWHRWPYNHLLQTTQLRTTWVQGGAQSGSMDGLKWGGGRGWNIIGVTIGSIYKITSFKCAMARVPVETLCILWENEPGHSPMTRWRTLIQKLNNSFQLIFTVVVGWSDGRVIFTIKTGIIYPWIKLGVECDTYGVTKHISNICGNNDEATKWMGYIRKGAWAEKCRIKIIVCDILLYLITVDNLLEYFRTFLDVLKHHCATLKLDNCKWFQGSCDFVGMDVVSGVTQPVHSKH